MRPEDREEIVAQFKLSLEDEVLTRSERKGLKRLIARYRPIQHDLNWVRSEIFDLAREACKEHSTEAVLSWTEEAIKLLISAESEDTAADSRVYFSPGNECLDAITIQLKQARSTVDICVFTISNNDITKAILEAKQRGVSVRIITDNDKAYDKGSDIYRMKDAGVPVRFDATDNHMHHKFATVDDKTVLTGSFNWTRSAVERNQENILITTEPKAIAEYAREFDRLWKKFD